MRHAARWAAAVTLGGGAAVLVSCNILGPATYFAAGQPKQPARYELIDRPTVVFVDDRDNVIPLNASRIRRAIADQVSTQLMAEEILTGTISSRDAMALARQQDRDGNLLSMEAIGESVGAQQIIYVEMQSFRGSPDNQTPRPTASCRVKVIDVVNRARLFPAPEADEPWEQIVVLSLPVNVELYQTSQGRREIEQLLAAQVGDRVAKLFYAHVPDEVGTRLGPR